MGLDVAELVLEIEESFHIRLAASDLERMHTVGDLYRFILKDMGLQRGGPCLSGVTFYRVRRALMQVIGVNRRDIILKRRIEDLVPRHARRQTWRSLGQALGGLRLAALVRPGWVHFLTTLAVLSFGGVYGSLVLGRPVSVAWVTALPLMAVFALLAVLITRPLAICVPSECITVRELVLEVLAHNHGRIASEANDGRMSGTEREVWDSLCNLISENLCVDRDRLTESTRFVEDLRLD
jgi:acyl carrier protein